MVAQAFAAEGNRGAVVVSKVLGFYDVARSEHTLYVRASGLANMNNVACFQEFTHEMVRRGFRRLVLDLDDCRGMDSTFMGCLIGLNEELQEAGAPSGSAVIVVNADGHCLKVIESLGLGAFLSLRRERWLAPDIELRRLADRGVSSRDRLMLIRRAHEDLVKIDQENQDRFGAFLSAVTEEASAMTTPDPESGSDFSQVPPAGRGERRQGRTRPRRRSRRDGTSDAV